MKEQLTLLELLLVDLAGLWTILVVAQLVKQLLHVHQRAHHLGGTFGAHARVCLSINLFGHCTFIFNFNYSERTPDKV